MFFIDKIGIIKYLVYRIVVRNKLDIYVKYLGYFWYIKWIINVIFIIVFIYNIYYNINSIIF